AGAQAEYKEMESAELQLTVDYKKKVPSPDIQLSLLVPGAPPRKLTPLKREVVESPLVQLEIASGYEDLAEATKDRKELKNLRQTPARKIEEKLTLEPGPQKIALAAKTENSARVE